MNRLLEALKSAHRIELLIIIAVLCVLLVLGSANCGRNTPVSSEAEMRMEHILSQIDGAGQVSVMLAEGEDGFLGCVVAAEGKDMKTVLELQRAVQALTALDLSRIEIVQSKR